MRLLHALSPLKKGSYVLASGLLDLIYPPCCLECGRRVVQPAHPLCFRCVTTLERAGTIAAKKRLSRLPAAQGLFATAFALWRFDRDGRLQKVQHALKYGNRPQYGVVLGRHLGRAYRDAFPEHPVPTLVVPVPLHRTRRLERGYNQSGRLARGVAAALGAKIQPGILQRARSTRSQTALSRLARWTNVAGAFVAHPSRTLREHAVLLVDDVLTTGATATAATQALHAAGASAVHLATLALARG